jgi:hypothetical protein
MWDFPRRPGEFSAQGAGYSSIAWALIQIARHSVHCRTKAAARPWLLFLIVESSERRGARRPCYYLFRLLFLPCYRAPLACYPPLLSPVISPSPWDSWLPQPSMVER